MLSPLPNLVKIYGEMLLIPHDDIWRIQNNDIYARIRDSISHYTGVEAEQVQLFCESVSEAIRNN